MHKQQKKIEKLLKEIEKNNKAFTEKEKQVQLL